MFKIRASQISKIMGGEIYPSLTKSVQSCLTKLEKGLKLTDIQQETYDKYQQGIQNPTLPQGAKTYVEDWYKTRLYDRRKEFKSKYTDKGNAVEDEAIILIEEALKFDFLIKNDHRYNDHPYIEGEPDVITALYIIDNKSSWDCFTFPLFKDKIDNDYWCQGQGYMILTGLKKYILVYTLMDMPEKIIDKLCFFEARDRGMDEVTQDLYLEVKQRHTYSHLPNKLRVKPYYFDYEEGYEEKVIERVKLCREYLSTLKNRF